MPGIELRRVVLLVVACWGALAEVGRAQAVPFSTERHLPGFSDAELGQDGDLYQLAEFKALEGKSLSLDQIDEARKKWQHEQERVAAELARLKADPAARSRRRLTRKIATHPFFSKVELVECADFPPLLFLVERPPKAQPGFEKAIARTQAPWLQGAIQGFEKEFAAVLPAARREGRALVPIAVLSSKGEFDNYWRVAYSDEYGAGEGHFERDVEMAVIYQDAFGETRDVLAQRKAALFGLMRSELSTWSPDDTTPRPLLWAREGIASLFTGSGGTAEKPAIPTLDPNWLPYFGESLTNDELREACLLPISELLAVTSWADLYTRIARRPAAAPFDELRRHQAHACFHVEARLFAWFLMREDGGSHRPLLERGLAELFGTREKLGAAASAKPEEPAALQKAFVNWAARELAKHPKKENALAPDLVARLATWKPEAGGGVKPGAAPPSAKGAKGAANAESAAPANAVPLSRLLDPSFRPDVLLEQPFPPEARVGVALGRAASGELDAAATELEALRAALAESEPLAPRIVRDVARLKAIAALRRELFERCRADKKKVKFEVDGVTTAGTLQEIADDALVVADAKGKLTRVPLASVSCDDLLKRMADLKLELGTPVARAYAAALAGRKNWAKSAAGTTPEETELRTDGEGTAALLDTGRAALRIEKLAKAPLPAAAASGESVFAAVKSLLVECGREPLVIVRKEQLRAFAALALAPQFETRGLGSLGVHAKVEALGGGRVKLTWSFDKPEEADDWTAGPYPRIPQWDEKLAIADKDAFMKIGGGMLRALGAKAWFSKLQFEAPIALVVHESYEEPPGEAPEQWPFAFFGASVCDDGRSNRIVTVNMAGLKNFDGAALEQDNEPTGYELATTYEVHLDHDGKKATLRCEGFPERSVPVLKRQSGRIGLLVYADMTVDVFDVSVEGKLAPASLVPLRDAWLEQELAKLDAAAAPKR